jgi:WD40 repeat protein
VNAAGTTVASGDATGRVIVWGVTGRQPLRTLLGHAGAVNAIALNRDGTLLASGGEDGKVLLHDLAGGGMQLLASGLAPVLSVALNRDGSLAAAGTEEGVTMVWELPSRRLVQRALPSAGAINALAFDGGRSERLYAGSAEGRLLTWDLAGATAR